MSGCVFFLVLQFGLTIVVSKRSIPLNMDDIVIYAKPAYKISAGSAAKLGMFPWAAAITFADMEKYNYCGGTIISKRHVVTAAHCVMEYETDLLPCLSATAMENAFDLLIRFGGICLRTESPPCHGQVCRTAGIRKIALHKRFMDEGCIHGFDFAIIELENDLMFDTTTSPICLVNSSFDIKYAQNLFDYGFGENEYGQKMSRLNYGSARIFNVSKVRDFIRAGPIYVPEGHTDPLHGICTGDSGGGLQGFVKNRAHLLGIHSFGPRECHLGTPFTVTDMRPYAEIICQLTGICYHL